jgi:dimethylargininase
MPSAIRAILRRPSAFMEGGERTHLDRAPIDSALAVAQHAAYAAALEAAGAQVTVLEAADDLPDCAFVEDVALTLPELCLVLNPGAASRRGEVEAVAAALPPDRPIMRLGAGTLDGGDVLVVGRRIFAGLSTRTSREGIEALAAATAAHGYQVTGVAVPGALHLKTAVTALDAQTLAINPAWIDAAAFPGFRHIVTAEGEPFGGNTLTVGGRLFVQAATPRTAEAFAAAGFAPQPLEIGEFAKAEAGLTCLSLIVPASA